MTPERNHRQNHGGWPMLDCWECQRAKAICRSKRTFQTREDAEADTFDLNVKRGWAGQVVVEYRCWWCALWHTTSATSTRQHKRVRRRHRRWLRTRAHPDTTGG